MTKISKYWIVIPIIIITLCVIIQSWVPFVSSLVFIFFVTLIPAIFNLLSKGEKVTVYIISDEQDANKYISDRRFKEEKNKETIH